MGDGSIPELYPSLTGLNTAASCRKSHLQQRVSDGWLCFVEIKHSGHPESTKREEAQQEGGGQPREVLQSASHPLQVSCLSR